MGYSREVPMCIAVSGYVHRSQCLCACAALIPSACAALIPSVCAALVPSACAARCNIYSSTLALTTVQHTTLLKLRVAANATVGNVLPLVFGQGDMDVLRNLNANIVLTHR